MGKGGRWATLPWGPNLRWVRVQCRCRVNSRSRDLARFAPKSPNRKVAKIAIFSQGGGGGPKVAKNAILSQGEGGGVRSKGERQPQKWPKSAKFRPSFIFAPEPSPSPPASVKKCRSRPLFPRLRKRAFWPAFLTLFEVSQGRGYCGRELLRTFPTLFRCEAPKRPESQLRPGHQNFSHRNFALGVKISGFFHLCA